MGLDTELAGLYGELDEELARLTPHCRACGECCHFKRFGHLPFATSLEVAYMLKNAHPSLPLTSQQDVCPYLSAHKCTIRPYRTLGCRVFFCQRDWQDTSQEIYHKYSRRIKELCEAHDWPWRYAPMLELLEEASCHA